MTTVPEETVWRWWCRQSAEQGLPPMIQDPAVIGRLVILAFAGTEGGGGRARSA